VALLSRSPTKRGTSLSHTDVLVFMDNPNIPS